MLDECLVDAKLTAVTFDVWVVWNTGRDDTVLCTRNEVAGALVLTTGGEFVVQLLVLPPAAFSGVMPGPTVFPSTLGSSTLGRVTRPLLVLSTPDVLKA